MVLKPDKTPLSISHPEIAEEWHPEKNDGVSPNQVVAGTGKKIWWKCSQGPDHEWRAKGADRTGINKSGCPCCNGKKVSVTNSLASKFPNIAVQLHPTKNDGVTADQIIAGSNKKYWWVCSEQPDHEWLTTSGARTGRGTGCPFCAHQKVSPSTSLAFRFPEIAQQWHLSKNGDITPEQIVAGSNIRAWWKCLEGPDHEWQVSAYSRTGASKSGCPYCRSLRVSITNSLSSRSPEIARQWHPTKNNGVTPNQVTAGSHTKYWWKCPVGPDHQWETTPGGRSGRGYGCPCCDGKKVSVTNSLASLFPRIAPQWHPIKNNGVTPNQVTAGSHTKYWWKCPVGPDHEWETTPGGRTSRGDGCPCCAGLKVSVTNSLASKFPDIAAQWHPTKNEDVSPEKVIAQTHTKYWWKCNEGPDHEWLAEPHSRVGAGSGCPSCDGKQVSITKSLASLFPKVAAELHPAKNIGVTADQIIAGSSLKYWWVCPKGPDHEWFDHFR